MSSDGLRQRLENQRKLSPRSLAQTTEPLKKAQFEPVVIAKFEGPTMKARCNRLAGRVVVVGRTAFSFDMEGVCKLPKRGRASEVSDFQLLLKRPGVEEIKVVAAWEEIPAPAAPLPAPIAPVLPPASEEPTVPNAQLPAPQSQEKTNVADTAPTADALRPVVVPRVRRQTVKTEV